MNVHLRAIIKVISILRVAPTHDGIGDDGINLDAGDAGAAIGHSPQDVHATARTDDGVFTVGPQQVG